VETGTHAQLLALGGLYARYWRRQSGGFIEAAE
jgi:ABC-type multidrug transport system fused ATPase/permease subunit